VSCHGTRSGLWRFELLLAPDVFRLTVFSDHFEHVIAKIRSFSANFDALSCKGVPFYDRKVVEFMPFLRSDDVHTLD
jgi:hypothetical protein